MKRYALVGTILFLTVILAGQIYAVTRENASPPGEVLDAATETTTAVRMYGVFAVEVTSSGVGTILIERSEDNSTNWVTVKTLTNTSSTEQRKFLYENQGDEGGRGGGAWYRAYLNTLTSGSYRVRLVK